MFAQRLKRHVCAPLNLQNRELHGQYLFSGKAAQRTWRTRSHGNRTGFSLIELLVVITMLTAILSLVGTTFYLLMKSEKLVTQSLVTERTISRLAVLFRDDVHQSLSYDMIAGTTTTTQELILKDSSGPRLRYRITKEGLARHVVENDKTISRDDFRLPDCQVNFSDGSKANSSIVSLMILRPTATITRNPKAPKPLHPLEIQAALNRRRPSSRPTNGQATNTEDKSEAQAAEETAP